MIKKSIKLTVFFDATGFHIKENADLVSTYYLNQRHRCNITDSLPDFNDPQFARCFKSSAIMGFNGCEITHGFKGSIFGTGLEEQCETVIHRVKEFLRHRYSVKLKVIGVSRGAIAALLLTKMLANVDPAFLEMRLLLLDPVPGNLITTQRIDIFHLTLASQAMDVSFSRNLTQVIALYPYLPIPAFHAPLIAKYPKNCQVTQIPTLQAHMRAFSAEYYNIYEHDFRCLLGIKTKNKRTFYESSNQTHVLIIDTENNNHELERNNPQNPENLQDSENPENLQDPQNPEKIDINKIEGFLSLIDPNNLRGIERKKLEEKIRQYEIERFKNNATYLQKILLKRLLLNPGNWIAHTISKNYCLNFINQTDYDDEIGDMENLQIEELLRHGTGEIESVTHSQRPTHSHNNTVIMARPVGEGEYLNKIHWASCCKESGPEPAPTSYCLTFQPPAQQQPIPIQSFLATREFPEINKKGLKKFLEEIYTGMSRLSRNSKKGTLLNNLKESLGNDEDLDHNKLLAILRNTVLLMLQRDRFSYSFWSTTSSALMAKKLLNTKQQFDFIKFYISGKSNSDYIRYRDLRTFAAGNNGSPAFFNARHKNERYQQIKNANGGDLYYELYDTESDKRWDFLPASENSSTCS